MATRAAHVVYADGRSRRERLSDDLEAMLWARCLHVGAAGLVEVVAARRGADGSLRMHKRSDPQRFPRAGDGRALMRLVRSHRARDEEVFCTPLTRHRPEPGLAGEVLAGRVAWVDLDEEAALERLREFPHRPELVVYSGSGGAHAYWRLARVTDPEQIEAANRRLAHALGGDEASTDRARIMRLPGTKNHKAGRDARIAHLDLAAHGHELSELVAGLKDPDPPRPPPSAEQVRRQALYVARDDATRIPPPHYFRVLAGREAPAAGGFVRCPLHAERVPSCMVYASPERGWRCFGGCDVGGSIYDLASLLEGGRWGRALRGEEFLQVKRAVHERFGLEMPKGATCSG